jgi:hypothetical protein
MNDFAAIRWALALGFLLLVVFLWGIAGGWACGLRDADGQPCCHENCAKADGAGR